MKKHLTKFIVTLLLVFLLGQTKKAHAFVIAGTEFFYTCTTTPNVYSVTLKIYRDCQGTELCSSCPTSLSPTCSVNISVTGAASPCNGSNFGTQTLTIQSPATIYEGVQLCSTSKTICTNCGTRTAGTFSPGIEVYTFTGLVSFAALPASCCQVRLGYNSCCRGNLGTTGIVNPTITPFYSELVINRCATPCNSSPIFGNAPEIAVCAGADHAINLGAYDPDGDSLSYALANSLSAAGTPVTYVAPYSATVPMPYLGAPVKSPPATLPTGIYVNPYTGDIMCRPNGNFVATCVVEVKQWKTVGTVPTLMGTTRRDILIWSQACPANSPVTLKKYDAANAYIGTYGYVNDSIRICPGTTFCRTFVASDTAVTDTTDLTWNSTNDMTGATFTPLYNAATRSINGPINDSMRFCWNIPLTAGRNAPYVLTVKGQDRRCALPAKILRSVAFYVYQTPLVTITKTLLSKNTRKLTYKLTNTATVNKSLTQWQLETTPGSNVFTTINSDSVTTFNFPISGRYKIKLLLTGPCGVTTINDSVDISFITLSLVQSKNNICKGDTSGLISVMASGASTTVQYKANNGAWRSNGNFTGLLAGAYVIVAKDSFNVTDTLRLTLTQPSIAVKLSVLSQVNMKCKGDSLGSVVLKGDSGYLPYQYKVVWGIYQSSTSISALPAGLQTFMLQDSLGCLATATATITEPNTKLNASLSVSQPLCHSDLGSVTVLGSGGNTPYQYKVDPSSYTTSNLFGSLSAGAYTFKIKDWNNCEKSYSATIVDPPLLVLGTSLVKGSCFGSNNGQIILNATGGTKPYLYKKGTGTYSSTNVFSNLAPGSYQFTVADTFNCTAVLNVTISQSGAITTTITGKNASCLGATNGSANVVITGGVKPYHIVWNANPSDSLALLGNLAPGYARVLVTDSNNCSVKDSVLIGYKPLFTGQQLCAIGTDTATGYHQVIWNKTPNMGVAGFIVLASTTATGTFSPIDSQLYNAYSLFTDTVKTNKYYQIKVVDSCNNSSAVSTAQNPLIVTLLASGSNNILTWPALVGQTNATSIDVLRSVNRGPFLVIKQLATNAVAFTDSLVPAGNVRYLLELSLNTSCNPTLNKAPVRIFSNLLDPTKTGLNEAGFIGAKIEVFPNPSTGSVQISSNNSALQIQSIEVVNLMGQKVKEFNLGGRSNEATIDLGDLADGVYEINVVSPKGQRFPAKVVLNR
ncbi:MAG: hypothetical protein CFE21_16185 [Bacteroidetes bacterium B1(2017)]|nr:MAG: hypothetical protein CFE21_16185 [Bacteroidetes bacterium B1(2017)]